MEKFKVSETKYVKFNCWEVLMYNRNEHSTKRVGLESVDEEVIDSIFLEFIEYDVTRRKLQRIMYSYYMNQKNRLSYIKSKKKTIKVTNANGHHGIMYQSPEKTYKHISKMIKELNEIRGIIEGGLYE